MRVGVAGECLFRPGGVGEFFCSSSDSEKGKGLKGGLRLGIWVDVTYRDLELAGLSLPERIQEERLCICVLSVIISRRVGVQFCFLDRLSRGSGGGDDDGDVGFARMVSDSNRFVLKRYSSP